MPVKMKTCKACGKEVAPSAKVCPSCGQKLKIGFGKKILIGVGVLIILGIIGSKSSDKTTTTTASSSTAKPTATTEPVKPAELSKEGISSNVTISVKGFESQDTIGDNQFSTAKAQGVFKVVTINIINNQKDAITIDSNSFKLMDDQKREFSDSSEAQMALMSSSSGDKGFFLKQINPGMSIDGHVVFDVPKDAKGFTLKARGGMTGKEIILKVE